MIQVLGTKRIMVLVFLIAFNAAIGAGVYTYLIPEMAKKDQELRAMESKVGQVRGDIDRLQIEFEQLEKQQAQFEVLKKEGFFSQQGRNQAQVLFNQIQEQSKVVAAVASVQAGELQENEETEKSGHVLLVSPIKISIDALEDIDVLRYLYLLDKSFPGHISIQNIDLERKSEITNTVWRSISSGTNPQLVKASIDLLWWTMIPQSDVIETQGN
jgi:hypothetical protein